VVEGRDTQVPMKSGLLAFFWIAGCIVASQSTGLAQSPVWTQEVLPDLPRSAPGISPGLLDGGRAGVAFLNRDQLMVYAVQSTGQLSSRRSPEISSAFQLRLSLLDAKSGEVGLTKNWGTRRNDSAVQMTTGGVLVKTGAIMKLYSTDFSKARDLPLVLDPNGIYYTSVSASGATVAVSRDFGKEKNWISHIDVLDAKTLKIRASWDQYPAILHLLMSDEKFITKDPFRRIVYLNRFANPAQSKAIPIAGPLKQDCPRGVGWGMVSDESIIMWDCNEVLLLNAGRVSSLLETLDGDSSERAASAQCGTYIPSMFNRTAVASDTRLAALSLPAVKVKKHLLTEPTVCLTGLQIAVYDLSRKQRVFTVNVAPLPQNDYDIALSPDGSKLAVLNDRRVSVYSVPVPTLNGGVAH
jgi:hypothetical protein